MGSDTTDFAARLRAAHERARNERGPDAVLDAVARGVWIYGAGGYGRIVHRLLAARGLPVHGFIDRRGDQPGLPTRAVTPEAFGRPGDATLVVALHSFGADPAPVAAWARARGFASVLWPGDLVDALGPEAGGYWLTARAHAAAHADALADTRARLADSRSRAVLDGIALFRAGAGVEAHPAVSRADQYFARDLPSLAPDARVVDGGACTGELLADAAACGVTIGHWWAFEPDPANFAELAAVARRADLPATLFPCGLGDRLGSAGLAGDGTSAALTGGGGGVPVVALDDVLVGAAPTLVKLDVEGFEAAALAGMAGTLARARPRLAVAVYHRPEDLWELPARVAELLPGAALHLRQHGHNGFDTVLYAVS